MESPAKLLGQLKKRVQSVTYGSPIYRLMLEQGPLPDAPRLTVPDLWPGNAKRGQAMIASQPALFENGLYDGTKPQSALMHEELRDLRAVGTDMARRKAICMIHEWIEAQDTWNEESWPPDVLGARIANWIGFFDFFAAAASHDFIKTMTHSLVRQLRHLQNIVQGDLTGMRSILAVKGLVYGGLCLTDSEKSLGLAYDLLARQLETEILPDGGHISRNPMMQATMLRALIDIRAALSAGAIEVPPELSLAIARMVPALKMLRHGDGCLALFNGASEYAALILDAIQTLSEAKTRLLKRLPQMGYERLTAGRSLLLIDVGAPPPRPYDAEAHAGLMSFEFSVGKERILTNCGAGPAGDEKWQRAMAATAAHNAVTMGDTNACEILPEGGIGHRPREVSSQRYEQEDTQFIDVSHDGYMPRYKVGLQRQFSLSRDGEELRVREVIAGPQGRDYTIRWHIHPSVTAMLAQSGSVLLRTASGSGWRLRVFGPCGDALALEPSVYCGHGSPHRTLQARVTEGIRENPTFVDWTLTREKIKKGT